MRILKTNEMVHRWMEQMGGKNYVNDFFNWFDEHVEPVNEMLSDGVEVYRSENSLWGEHHCVKHWNGGAIEKALLINTKPIKRETAEDVLRDLIENHPGDITDYVDIKKRAKAVLEGK